MLSATRIKGQIRQLVPAKLGVVTACASAWLVSACMVGPDFTIPGPPPVSNFLPLGAALATPDNDQRLLHGASLPSDWWGLLASPALTTLVRRGLDRNPDVKAQEAAILAAHHLALAQRGALFPTLNANLNVTRQKVATESQTSNAASGSSVYSVHTAQLTASYVPDLFGGTRRLIEAAESQVVVEALRREALVLTLAANIATAAIQEASLRGQIAVTGRLIGVQNEILSLLRRQETAGQIAQTDVATQEMAVAQARLLLPPLEKQLGQQRNLLATLTGGFPGDGVIETFEITSFKLPRQLPISLPADLVRQRPDIRVAEELVRIANAQVGVAIANRLPQIKLTGNAGSAASALSKLFSPGTGLWLIAADAVQPLFDGFALRHKQRAAEAQLVQATEQYRGVAIVAFGNVADALMALEADAKALAAATAAERAASRTIELLRRQLEQGQISLPNLLVAQQAYLQSSLARVQAQAARLADTVALFQALGGGWWREDLVLVEANRHPDYR